MSFLVSGFVVGFRNFGSFFRIVLELTEEGASVLRDFIGKAIGAVLRFVGVVDGFSVSGDTELYVF